MKNKVFVLQKNYSRKKSAALNKSLEEKQTAHNI